MRISDWSSDVCSSDLAALRASRRPLSRAPQHEDASFCHQKIHLILRSMAGLLARPCVSKDARVPLQYFEINSGQRAPEAEGRAGVLARHPGVGQLRSDEHTSDLPSLMSSSYDVFGLT